jgi:hypothetical protein
MIVYLSLTATKQKPCLGSAKEGLMALQHNLALLNESGSL